MNVIKDKSWLPECSPKRIITHWTAGSYWVSGLDKEHYHFIIDGEGNPHRGYHSILKNMAGSSGPYAAHTYGLNTDSIGVSVACMGGVGVSKTSPGRFPLKKSQWLQLAKLVSELCIRYSIPVNERTVLQHGDVHRVYGIDQWGKWDINFLPWAPKISHEDVGHEFRRLVKTFVDGKKPDSMDKTNGVKVTLNGDPVGEGVVENGVTLLPVRELAEALGLRVAWDAKTRTVELSD